MFIGGRDVIWFGLAFGRSAPTFESAPSANSASTAQSELIVIHSDEFEAGLADFGCPSDPSNEVKTPDAENRLAVNVVLALSKNPRVVGDR